MTVIAPILPPEVLFQVVAYVEGFPYRQHDLWAMTMASRSWYHAAIPSLYHSPTISGRNFTSFVRTICPSVNAHVRKTSFSSMIKELDMGRLVHDSCRSLTARILSRLKDGLEVFVAPRASFAVNCLAALSKCQHLRQLDLSLIAEGISLPRLLHSIRNLACLERLSIRCKDDVAEQSSDMTWPPRLQTLEASGTFTDSALGYFHLLPKSLTSFIVHDTPRISSTASKDLIRILGPELESLHIGPRTFEDNDEYLVEWIEFLPKLKRLHIHVPAFFNEYTPLDSYVIPPKYHARNPHPLEHLELDCRDHASQVELEIEHYHGPIFEVVAEGFLGRLRQVTFIHSGDARFTKHDKQVVHELDDLLRALAREDGEHATIREEHAGATVVRV